MIDMQALLPATRKVLAHPSSHRDDAIRESVTRVLKASGYRPLAALSCHVDRGVVELAGVVPTFYLKQLAQETVLPLDHVNQVKNRVQVI
jgi:osmotically-inducible protein OsmY